MVVDHRNQAVYNGGKVFSIKHLQNFMNDEERINKMELFIDAMLEDNPRMITYDLNNLLWRQFGCRISKGRFHLLNGKKMALSQSIQDTLKYNFILQRVQAFAPKNEAEREILCRIWKIDDYSLIRIEPHTNLDYTPAVQFLKDMTGEEEKIDLRAALKANHLAIFRIGPDYYCVDFTHHCIFNLADVGIAFKDLFSVSQDFTLHEQQHRHQTHVDMNNPVRVALSHATSAHSRNAEWEVGGKENYEVDDERALKR